MSYGKQRYDEHETTLYHQYHARVKRIDYVVNRGGVLVGMGEDAPDIREQAVVRANREASGSRLLRMRLAGRRY